MNTISPIRKEANICMFIAAAAAATCEQFVNKNKKQISAKLFEIISCASKPREIEEGSDIVANLRNNLIRSVT